MYIGIVIHDMSAIVDVGSNVAKPKNDPHYELVRVFYGRQYQKYLQNGSYRKEFGNLCPTKLDISLKKCDFIL